MLENGKNQITKLWISQIRDFINNLDIDSEIKIYVETLVEQQHDLIKNGMVTDDIFGAYGFGSNVIEILSKECLTFIKYLYELLDRKGIEYFKTAIDYAVENNNMSFLDNLIRFVVITNYNEIEIVDNLDSDRLLNNMNDYSNGQGSIKAYLGGFLLCDMSQFSAHQDESGKYLDFYSFHSRKNMTRTRIGTLVVQKVLQKMNADKNLCDFSLGSGWVMKNNALAKKFYEQMGFKFLDENGNVVDYHYYDDYIKIKREDYPNLTDIEFHNLSKKMSSNFCVIIPSNEKQAIANRSYEYPFVELNGQRIDWTTEFGAKEKK